MHYRFGRIGRSPATVAHGQVHLYGCLLLCIISVQVGLHAWFLHKVRWNIRPREPWAGINFWWLCSIALFPCLLHIAVSHQTIKFGWKTPKAHLSAPWKTLTVTHCAAAESLWRGKLVPWTKPATTTNESCYNFMQPQLHQLRLQPHIVTTAMAAMAATPCTATGAYYCWNPPCSCSSLHPYLHQCNQVAQSWRGWSFQSAAGHAKHSTTAPVTQCDTAIIPNVRCCFGNTGTEAIRMDSRRFCASDFGRKILILVLNMLS